VVDAEGFGPGYVNVLRQLQPEFRSPVVLLAPPQDERDQILSLESGATEIVVKPASPRLLAAKMRRLIEVGGREPEVDADQVRLGPLTMHARRGTTLVGEVPVKLTVHQFELLFLLASRAGRYVDRETIAMRLRGTPEEIGRSADVHVYRIRRKLKEQGIDSLKLDTVYGRGYMLSLDEAEASERRGLPAPLHLV
jgi:DNA-binding response OmpR family regulator